MVRTGSRPLALVDCRSAWRLAVCLFLSLFLCMSPVWADGLESLDDNSLASVSGAGNGIAFDIVMQFNTDSGGTPLGNATQSSNCQGNTTGCPFLLALQVENRAGSWLVLKDLYGLMKINNLNLDAYVNPTANTSYWNKNRYASAPFQASLSCISDIASCNPAGMASFMLSFNNAAVNYNNVQLYLNIGRMALEFDKNVAGACASVNDTTNCGYVQDNGGSFAGVLVSDVSQKPAQISVQGQVRVYGF